jgi:hypothetical protein
MLIDQTGSYTRPARFRSPPYNAEETGTTNSHQGTRKQNQETGETDFKFEIQNLKGRSGFKIQNPKSKMQLSVSVFLLQFRERAEAAGDGVGGGGFAEFAGGGDVVPGGEVAEFSF